MTNPLTVEAIYLRLGALIADAPNFKNPTPETRHWVARVLALIEVGNLVDAASLAYFCKSENEPGLRCRFNCAVLRPMSD